MIIHIIHGGSDLCFTKPQIGGGMVHHFDPAVKKDDLLLSSGIITQQSEGQPIAF